MTEIHIPWLRVHGAEIPQIGFGTSGLGDNAGEVVATALKSGYRHIDTAWKYGTERGVGEGIRASGVRRKEIFLTTKVSHEYLRAAEVERSSEESKKNLKVVSGALLLILGQNRKFPLRDPVAALAKMRGTAPPRHIGVANFPVALLDEAV